MRAAASDESGRTTLQFTVGFKLEGRANHVAVDGEDAFAAAREIKTKHPDALITYVRRRNRRGDARHPEHKIDDRVEQV